MDLFRKYFEKEPDTGGGEKREKQTSETEKNDEHPLSEFSQFGENGNDNEEPDGVKFTSVIENEDKEEDSETPSIVIPGPDDKSEEEGEEEGEEEAEKEKQKEKEEKEKEKKAEEKEKKEAKEKKEKEEKEEKEKEKKEDISDKEEEKPSLKIPGKNEDNDDEISEEVKEYDWNKISKALGIEIEGDEVTPSSIKEKVTAKTDQLKSEGKKEAFEFIRKDPFSAFSDDLNDNQKQTIQYIAKGGDVSKLALGPVFDINKYTALKDEDLVKEHLKSKTDKITNERIYNDEEIENKIAKYEEEGELKEQATEIRNRLRGISDKYMANVVKKQQEEEKSLSEKQKQKNKEFKENLNSSIKDKKEFLGSTITQEHQDHIDDLVQSGKVDQILSDPKKVADFLYWNEFGEQALKILSQNQFNAGKEKAMKNRHKVQNPSDAHRGQTTPAGESGGGESDGGNFQDWERRRGRLN